MSSQEAFLARVQRALHKEAGAPRGPLLWPEPDDCASPQQTPGQRASLIAQIQHELEAVGGKVAHVTSVAQANQYITRLAQEKHARLVVRWQAAVLDTLEIDAALQHQGVEVHTTSVPHEDPQALAAQRQSLRALLAQADVGLSGVDYVIAETGTLALTALPGQMRGVSLLPPVHVAVARAEQICATLADVLQRLQSSGTDLQQQLSSCIAFITGPSRTGDIELKLTVGVHGPGELHLIILDDPGAEHAD